MVEVIRQNVGNISSIRLQVSAVSCDECGSIPWDEFQVCSRVRHKHNVSQYTIESGAHHLFEFVICLVIRFFQLFIINLF